MHSRSHLLHIYFPLWRRTFSVCQRDVMMRRWMELWVQKGKKLVPQIINKVPSWRGNSSDGLDFEVVIWLVGGGSKKAEIRVGCGNWMRTHNEGDGISLEAVAVCWLNMGQLYRPKFYDIFRSVGNDNNTCHKTCGLLVSRCDTCAPLFDLGSDCMKRACWVHVCFTSTTTISLGWQKYFVRK